MESTCLRRYGRTMMWAGLLLLIAACVPGRQPATTAAPAATATAPPLDEAVAVAELAAVEANIRVLRGEGQAEAVSIAERFAVLLDDLITVDEQGRGELIFQGQIAVELFRDTQIQVAEVRMESGGPASVRLNQVYGHIRLRVADTTSARATLVTDYATLQTLEPGTEFMVCHAPGGLTCMVTVAGSVEVSSQGTKEVITGGEATYIFPDEAPQPPICARRDEVIDWGERKRGSGDVEALGELVAGWPAEPCTAAVGPAATTLPAAKGMVNIPAGEYEVGSNHGDDFHPPVQKQVVDAFWIDSYEVTNAQYQQYMEAVAQAPPLTWPGEPNHPVKGVSWDQALAYCSWVNKRLPSELEWEVAARGPGPTPRIYPWGDDPLAGGQATDLPRSTTYPVGTFDFNVSPFGAYDMVGNVWEWVGEPLAAVGDNQHVLRGGRHGFLVDAAYREVAAPDDDRFVQVAGFRCAATRVEGE